MRVDHLLLTRFNLPSPGPESLIRAREHWLRQRIELFERYCLPSVVAQTQRPYWIIYLDPESPSWLVERMEKHAAAGTFTPIYREAVPREALLRDLHRTVLAPGDLLVTTNLDNDDGLACDFSARVREAARSDLTRRVLYVDLGLIVGGGRAFLRRDTHNAFCSVAEPWSEPRTCWSAWHNALERQMPAVHVLGGPGWLQVIHGDNVSNRIRGRLVDPRPYRSTFPGLIDDVRAPSRTERIRDTLLAAPLRSVREAVRSLVKRVVLATGGQDAVDRLLALRAAARTLLGSRQRQGR